MGKLDPTKMKDWEIAAAAEENMKTVYQLAEEMGVQQEELLLPLFLLGCDFFRFIRIMDRSQPRALPLQQASGPPIAHRIVAAPALGEGDADAAGNGLWGPTHYSDEPQVMMLL